jgi:hypothetical protein
MTIINQISGGSYDTNDYPCMMTDIHMKEVYGRFSTLEQAQKNRIFHSILYPNSNPLLFNGKTNKFIDWTKKDLNRVYVLKKEYEKNSDINKLTKKIFGDKL